MNRIEQLLGELDETKSKLATAEERATTLAADLESAKAQAASGNEAQNKVVELTAELTALKESVTADKAALEAANAKVAELTASQADFDQRLAAEVAKLGIRNVPVETPKPGESAEEIRAQFAQMPAGRERSAFFQKHKAVLGLGAK